MELDDDDYIKVASPSTRTNIPDVFRRQVFDHTYRQASTAASGCHAALDAERYLAALADSRTEKVLTVAPS